MNAVLISLSTQWSYITEKLEIINPYLMLFLWQNCEQKIPKNISQTFSSALHSNMEDKNGLQIPEPVHLKSFHSISICCL